MQGNIRQTAKFERRMILISGMIATRDAVKVENLLSTRIGAGSTLNKTSMVLKNLVYSNAAGHLKI